MTALIIIAVVGWVAAIVFERLWVRTMVQDTSLFREAAETIDRLSDENNRLRSLQQPRDPRGRFVKGEGK